MRKKIFVQMIQMYANFRLWVQGDNTPKELRNSFTGKWACMMVQGRYFKGVSHHHMVVGHTHEDIGAVWGQIEMILPLFYQFDMIFPNLYKGVVFTTTCFMLPVPPVQMDYSHW